MKRRIPAALAAATIGACALIPAGDALAAASDCTPGVFCVWVDTNFNGARKEMANDNASWAAWGIWMNDESAFNKRSASTYVRIRQGVGPGGAVSVCVGRGSQIAAYSPANSGQSNDWTTSC